MLRRSGLLGAGDGDGQHQPRRTGHQPSLRDLAQRNRSPSPVVRRLRGPCRPRRLSVRRRGAKQRGIHRHLDGRRDDPVGALHADGGWSGPGGNRLRRPPSALPGGRQRRHARHLHEHLLGWAAGGRVERLPRGCRLPAAAAAPGPERSLPSTRGRVRRPLGTAGVARQPRRPAEADQRSARRRHGQVPRGVGRRPGAAPGVRGDGTRLRSLGEVKAP